MEYKYRDAITLHFEHRILDMYFKQYIISIRSCNTVTQIRHNSVTSLSTASSYPLYMTTTPRPHCTALPGLTLTRDQIATHPRPQPGTGHADTALDTWCGHADMLRVNTPQLDTSLDGRNCQHQPPSCYKPIDKLDISM